MKTVKKINDRNYRKIGEHEHWFQDMAAKGLLLKKMGRRFIYFTKDEPKQMRYRILGLYEEPLTQTKKAEYAKQGWDYVTDYYVTMMNYDISVFSSPDERGAPEIFENQPGLEKYLNKNKKSGIIPLVIILIAFGLFEWSLLTNMPLILPYVDWSIEQPLTLLLFFMLFFLSTISAFTRMIKRKDIFDEGLKIDHSAPWEKMRRSGISALFIHILTTLFFILAPLAGISGSSDTTGSNYLLEKPGVASILHYSYAEKNLPAGATNLPIVRLADIEKNPKFEKVKVSFIDGLDQNNNYTYKTNLLAPMKLVTYENGSIYKAVWNEEGLPYLETHVYQLKYAWMSKYIADDLVKEYIGEQDIGSVEQRSNPELDKLLVYQDDYFTAVIAAKGRAVIYAKYRGDALPDTLIKAVAEKIAIISD